ncbi:ankyrin repeat domain-containing protein [Arcobacter sp. CECT 8986]|uniref:ankyrin repeat domain-containing protein n=1 Tax=Arcobacter sp. CECT 8986 TaxID=2044507 RepID=UPI0013E99089|nr:ankyrin repeat domain-containing protein [Arcobacter sp. CECT 8986]
MKSYIVGILVLVLLAGCVASNLSNKQNSITLDENDILLAVRTNDYEKVKSLVSKDNVNKVDTLGYTPLHIAARNNNVEIAKLLIDNNAKLDEKDNFKDTALLDAIKNNYIDMSKLLICNGANINIKDEQNLTTKDYINRLDNSFLIDLINADDKELLCKENEALNNELEDLIPQETEKEETKIVKKELVTIDNYPLINNKRPLICGDVLDLNTKNIVLSIKDKTYDVNIKNNRWCTNIKDKLENGVYTLKVMASYDNFEDIKQEEISIYVLDALQKDLINELSLELPTWAASLDENSLTVTFSSENSFFENNELKESLKKALNEFIPKYVKVLRKYENQIVNVIILSNESLSEEGTVESSQKVYDYLKNIDNKSVQDNIIWIEKNIFADENLNIQNSKKNIIEFKIEVSKN